MEATFTRTSSGESVTGRIFTPDVDGWNRVMMLLSERDMEEFNALPGGPSDETVRVEDLLTESIFTVKRSDCGAGCYCGATIVADR